jgi:hypothetical protein
MAIVRWDPWGDLGGFREKNNRRLDEEFGMPKVPILQAGK